MVAGESDPNQTKTQAIPPRYWWLKRITIGAVAILLILLGVRLWWGWKSHQQLQALVATYQADGQPVYPEDFDPPPLRDGDNAALLYKEAGSLLAQPIGVTLTPEEIWRGKEVLATRLDEARTYIEANGPALALARQARERTSADWGTRLRSPAINFMLPSFSAQRSLARTLCAAAAYHHVVGDDREAIECLRDAHALAVALRRDPTLISNLVGLAIDALALSVLEDILPTLSVELSDEPAEGQPVRASLRALQVELSNESPQRLSMVRAAHVERTIMFDMGAQVAGGGVSLRGVVFAGRAGTKTIRQRVLFWPIAPLIEGDTTFMMRRLSAWAHAASQSNWPDMQAVAPPEGLDDGLVHRLRHPLSSGMLPSLSRYFQLEYRFIAMRRMAVLAMAIRSYEVDQDRRPGRLADLAPEYVPELPPDSYATEHQPLQYRRDVKPPILYTVFMNGVDDAGSYRTKSPRGFDWWNSRDLPFFLDGDRPE